MAACLVGLGMAHVQRRLQPAPAGGLLWAAFGSKIDNLGSSTLFAKTEKNHFVLVLGRGGCCEEEIAQQSTILRRY